MERLKTAAMFEEDWNAILFMLRGKQRFRDMIHILVTEYKLNHPEKEKEVLPGNTEQSNG